LAGPSYSQEEGENNPQQDESDTGGDSTQLTIDDWMKEIRSTGKKKILDQFSFVMIKKMTLTEPQFFPVRYPRLNKLGLLKFKGVKQWEHFLDLNPDRIWTKKTIRPYLFKGLSASRVLLCRSKTCDYLKMNGDKIEKLKSTQDKPSKMKPKAVIKWWKEFLGYAGVIIDRKDNQFLIAGLTKFNRNFKQALAFKNSANLEFIDQTKQKGDALLALAEAKGPIAIYKILVRSQSTMNLEPGTKVIIDEGNTPGCGSAAPIPAQK
jgi:hypothetical protein